ncbi:hypothetical protein PGT21_011790 [Puccinia graminis f. sp. tritici]|uniref:Velvet domain-containing protein n=1 Tax=Puccinia graminis f. sp. tritici TaxID=56615 RepID=A0A5B0R0A4_PUCGR|nr:hypothetical protein PGT21_011790 [Puccinia graminis f. sp. tritici]
MRFWRQAAPGAGEEDQALVPIGLEEELVRHPLAPAPVLEALRYENGRKVIMSADEATRLIVSAHPILLNDDGNPIEEVPLDAINFDPPRGALYDPPNAPAEDASWIFVFDDIGIRTLGRYVIHFCLMRIPRECEEPPEQLAHATTDAFEVVEEARWPLFTDFYTELSARLNRDHDHLNIYRPRYQDPR